MAQQLKPAVASLPPVPPDPYPEYRPIYAWLFQAWLVMFLLVICFSLAFYLLSFVL